MRILEFNVEKQRIKRTPGCDFSHIVAGTVGYLQMQFHFSPEWDECVKAVSFWRDGKEESVKLDENNMCEVPESMSSHKNFDISVTGGKTGYRIKTSKYHIRQEVD